MSEAIPPRHAVLFKTHFWDDFVARRFAALQSMCPRADLWVAIDETLGPIDNIPHDKVFRTNEQDMHALGMPEQPGVRLNWYNTDYQLLAFHQAHRSYAFYTMVEFDAVVQRNLDTIASDALQQGIDLIAFPIDQPVATWNWTHTLEDVWPHDDIQLHLLCISGFSSRAVAHLLLLRQDHAARYARGEFPRWPFCEGFVPTALNTAGFCVKSLANFGTTASYRWWPPHHEAQLPDLAHHAFLHPVLTGHRYVASLLRYARPETYLTSPESMLRQYLDRESPHIVIPPLIKAFMQDRNSQALLAMHQTIQDRGWRDQIPSLAPLLASFATPQPPHNLALHKSAWQSSVSDWSRDPTTSGDAAFAVDGVISGDYGFHTSQEFQPWWMVDLAEPCLINEIRIYNRLTSDPSIAARANHLSIWNSTNGRGWDLLHRHASETPFGGADGNPLVVPCPAPVIARFIRIECDGLAIFHLDEVEVIGLPLLPH